MKTISENYYQSPRGLSANLTAKARVPGFNYESINSLSTKSIKSVEKT